MSSETIGKLTYGVKVDLVLKVPALFGFRVRVASLLCGLAAWVMQGRMNVEVDPQVEVE